MQEARRDHAGAVDQHTDHIAACGGKADIDRVCRRWRCRIETDQAKISRQAFEHGGIERRVGAVVDDDDLVVVGRDVALIFCRQRIEGARRLPRYVVDDDDDRDLRLGHATPKKGILRSDGIYGVSRSSSQWRSLDFQAGPGRHARQFPVSRTPAKPLREPGRRHGIRIYCRLPSSPGIAAPADMATDFRLFGDTQPR